MIYSDVIIIGGGPAGSTCGWKLREQGIECLILDKQTFPRAKTCAGWITPQVLKELQIDANHVPYSFKTFRKIYIHVYGKRLDINTRQHSIQRPEFDAWLLQRSGVRTVQHLVKYIHRERDVYVIDDQFRCRYLIGAGGTYCPVYRTFFRNIHPRKSHLKIIGLDCESQLTYNDDNCYLWFYENRLPGYCWYVPKENGYLNLGVGGFMDQLKNQDDTITHQWVIFLNKLKKMSLIEKDPPRPRGYAYYMRDDMDCVQRGRVYLLGDAAGLATKDMGQGIGSAVKSGLLAADAIIKNKSYSVKAVHRYTNQKYRVFMRLIDLFQGWPLPG